MVSGKPRRVLTMRCAVIGHPVGHSLSPALHLAAYRELGLDWSYDAVDVTHPGLPAFISGLDAGWRGLSVTMPHKQAIRAFGRTDPLVDLVGAGNTLVLEPGGNRVYNTDVSGLVAALTDAGVHRVREVAIIGNGATARSALVSCARLGATRVQLLVRDTSRAAGLLELGERLGVEVIATPLTAGVRADLLVSTIPAEPVQDQADRLAHAAPVLFDVRYDPWPTRLAAAAAQAGAVVLNGLDLLVWQAVDQVELMTGQRVAASTLMSAGLAELGRRADQVTD